MITYEQIAKFFDPLHIVKPGEQCPSDMAEYFIKAWGADLIGTELDGVCYWDIENWLDYLVGPEHSKFYMRKWTLPDSMFYEPDRYETFCVLYSGEAYLRWMADTVGLSYINMAITSGRRKKGLDYTRVWQVSDYIAARAILADEMRRSNKVCEMVKRFLKAGQLTVNKIIFVAPRSWDVGKTDD